MDFVALRQFALLEIEHVNDLIAGAGAIKAAALAREFQAVKGFMHIHLRDDFGRLEVHDSDFVLRISAMEHGGEAAFWMDGDVNWKITQLDLPPCWPQGPLIGQEHGAVSAGAGQFNRWLGLLRERGGCRHIQRKPNEAA